MKKTKNILNTKGVFAIVPLLILIIVIGLISNAYFGRGSRLSRYRAYKALALSLGERGSIGDEPDFEACRNYLIENSIIPAESDSDGESAYTYKEMKLLYSMLPQDKNFDGINKKSDKSKVRERDFYDFYLYWVSYKDSHGFVKNEEDQIYHYTDNNGIPVVYTYRGGAMFLDTKEDPRDYLDKRVNIIYASGELLYVKEILSDEVSYANVYIHKKTDEGTDVLIRSARREIPFSKDFDTSNISEDAIGVLELKEGRIVSFASREEIIKGRVLAVDNKEIELEGYGVLEAADDFSAYIPEKLERQSLRKIPVGSFVYDFYIADGKVQAAIKRGEYSYDTIRVLISNTNFAPLHHGTITLKGEGNIKVRIGESEKIINAGEEFSVNRDTDAALFAGGKRMFISSYAPIALTSVERGLGVPVYSGRLEITKGEKGLYLINELEVEDYLRKVVASEVPSGFDPEAIKAQALGARTYAYMNIIGSNDLNRYGAHLDDSDRFQVYNNAPTSEVCDAAVRDTKGQAIYYKDTLADTFYYSTSAGVSTDLSIWGRSPSDYPYITSHAIAPGKEREDLSTDEKFKAFLDNTEFPAYDKEYSLYRWELIVSAKQLEKEITEVSGIENLTITKRGPGGIALALQVDGKSGSHTITGQNPIRAALCSPEVEITNQKGDKSSGFDSLHSSFIYIEKIEPDEEGNERFRIKGGGRGHGIGMSQNAANEMGKSGMDYKEIINFFFSGVEIR